MRIRSLGLLVAACLLTFTSTDDLWRSFWLNKVNVLALSNVINTTSPVGARLFTGFEFETDPADPSISTNSNGFVSRLTIVAEFTAKRYPAALRQADIFLSKNPVDPAVLTLKGDALWIMHDTLPAIEAWKQAGYYQRLIDAGQFLVLEKQFQPAQSAWEAAIQVDPDNWRAWMGLGNMFWDQGDVGAAQKVYEVMVDRNFVNMGNLPYANLGLIYAEQGRFEESKRVVELGLVLWPRDIPIRISQGIALARGGEEARAVLVLNQVLLDDPMNRDACYWIGWAYARQNDDVLAIDQYSICLDRFPKDIGIRYELGMAFTRQGRIAEAREQFLRILEIDPAFQRAKDRLHELGVMP